MSSVKMLLIEQSDDSLSIFFSLPLKIVVHIPAKVCEWAVVVAQLVERLLPTAEVHRSNPVIGKNFGILNVYCQLY